jgi:hypothetical protein
MIGPASPSTLHPCRIATKARQWKSNRFTKPLFAHETEDEMVSGMGKETPKRPDGIPANVWADAGGALFELSKQDFVGQKTRFSVLPACKV